MSLEAVNLGLGSCILCDTLYIENEINDYLGIKEFEQVCGFIVGTPIYNYPPKRKKDLNELASNLYDSKSKDENGLTRIEREFSRAKEQGIKVILLIEIDNMHSKIMSSKHFRYDKASRVSPKAFNSILRSLQARYNISIEYCEKNQSARLIHDILYYHAREYLKNVSMINDSYVVEERQRLD